MSLTDTTNDLAFDLFARWEDQKVNGNPVPLEQVCASHPEALPRVMEIARQLSLVSSLFPSGPPPEPSPSDAVVGHPADWVEVGRGASSVVYRGHDPTFGTTVAYKVLHTHGRPLSPADAVRLMKRFELEARILARLKHDGIVRIFKTFAVAGRPTLVMEYLPGGSLVSHMAAIRGQGGAAVARLFERVALAVGFAHQQGIIHRDLKPSNILLGADGLPCVSDFGVAKLVHPLDLSRPPLPPTDAGADTAPETECLTAFGRQPGTKAYMAPEQFDPAFGPVTTATDVWALGVIIYEMVNGDRPFAALSAGDWHAVVCRGPLPARRQTSWSRAGRLEAVALKCLSRDPAKRYPTAAAVAAAVAAGLGLAAFAPGLIDRLGTHKSGGGVPTRPHAPRAEFERDYLAAYHRCVDGKVSQGLSEFAALLSRVPADAPELREAVRANIAGWAGSLAAVDGVYAHPEAITALAVSPDGRRVAIGDERGGVVIWGGEGGSSVKQLNGHSERVVSMAFSRDGRSLATGGFDSTVMVWAVDGPTSEPTHLLRTRAYAFAVALTPDGEHVVTGTSFRDLTGVNFWNLKSEQLVDGPSDGGEVRSFVTAPDGETLIAVFNDRDPEVWDLNTRRRVGSLDAGGKEVSILSAAFSPDGKAVATGGDALRLWDTATRRMTDEALGEVEVVGFSTDGDGVVVSGVGGWRVWRPAADCTDPLPLSRPTPPDRLAAAGDRLSGVENRRTVLRYRWPVRAVRSVPVPRGCVAVSVATSADAWRAAVITAPDGQLRTAPPSGGIQLWDLRAHRPAGPPVRTLGAAALMAELDADGRTLAFQPGRVIGQPPDPPRLAVVATGDNTGSLSGHQNDVCHARHLKTLGGWVTAGDDGRLCVHTGGAGPTASAPLPDKAVRLAVSRDEGLVAAAAYDGSVCCFRSSAAGLVKAWEHRPGKLADRLQFSPDGRHLLSVGRDHRLRAWATADATAVDALGGAADVTDVQPYGGGWVTHHTDGVVRRWPALTAVRPAGEWHLPPEHMCVGLEPTGESLVTATADGKAYTWWVRVGLPVGPPVGHKHPVRQIAWANGSVLSLSRTSVREWPPADTSALPVDDDVRSWLNGLTSGPPSRPSGGGGRSDSSRRSSPPAGR